MAANATARRPWSERRLQQELEDAFPYQETVDQLVEDLAEGRLLEPSDPDRDSLEQLLDERKPEHVTYEGWEAIDRSEREAGEPHGRPRVKLTRFEQLLEAARERVSS